LDEKKSVESDIEEISFDYLHFGALRDTPYQRTILGPQENIKRISRNDLLNFIDMHYNGPRITVIATGDVEHDKVSEYVQKYFNKLSPIDKFVKPNWSPITDITPSEIRINTDSNSSHITIGLKGTISSDPASYIQNLFQSLFLPWEKNVGGGSHFNSTITQKLHDAGAISFKPYSVSYKYAGLQGFQIETSKNINTCLEVLFKEPQRIFESLTEEDIKVLKQKKHLNSTIKSDPIDTIDDIFHDMDNVGRRVSIPEILMRVDSITLDQMKDWIYKYFNNYTPSIVAIGKGVDEFYSYDKIQKLTHWN